MMEVKLPMSQAVEMDRNLPVIGLYWVLCLKRRRIENSRERISMGQLL